MDQLEMLWEYQKTDMAVDRLRKSLLNSPERKRLVQLKDKMKTQKALIEQIDEDISMMADRLDALQDAVKRNSDQAKILQGKIEKTQDQLTAITSLIGEVKRAQSVLNTYESEIKSIRSNTSDKEKEQIDSKKRFVKLRNEYEALKVVYDEAVQKCNEQLESMLGTKVGSASVLSLLHDPDNRVQLVLDKQAFEAEWYGCSDTTTTGYMKLPTAELLDKFLPETAHAPIWIEV